MQFHCMLHFVSEINILAITLTENVGVIFCYGDEYHARIYAMHGECACYRLSGGTIPVLI